MKILKLNIEEINDDFLKGTRLLCITAPIKKHLFCWHLNTHLGFTFKLCNEKEIPVQRKNRKYYFSIYHSHEANNPFIEHILYHTQYDGEYLLPELKHMDYLWLVRGEVIEDAQFNWIREGIKKISGVLMVAELTPEQIKSKGNLIFDLE